MTTVGPLIGYPNHRDCCEMLTHGADWRAWTLIDIDGMAALNLDSGWQTADRVVEAVGRHLLQLATERALPAFRVRGDKFLVLAPGLEQLTAWLPSFQQAIACLRVASVHSPDTQVSASVSIATGTLAERAGTQAEAVVRRILELGDTVLHRSRNALVHVPDAVQPHQAEAGAVRGA